MMQPDEALRLVLENSQPAKSYEQTLLESLGRYLAVPIISQFDYPAFDHSAVDGFAIRCEDSPGDFLLGHRVLAGDLPSDVFLNERTTVRVLTGAPLPPGFDAVVMQEECEWEANTVSIAQRATLGQNVRRRGEEYFAGQTLISAGIEVNSGIIGLAASNGLSRLTVHRRPRVAVIATGSELISVGQVPLPGQILDSNSWAFGAAALSAGADTTRDVVRDDPLEIGRLVGLAIENSDIVVASGGVALGDADYVRQAFSEQGVREVFFGLSMKPGKGVYFGMQGERLVFGLPGNPAAAMIAFHLFVRPAIRKLAGAGAPTNHTVLAKLANGQKKRPGRTEFVQANLRSEVDGLWADARPKQGSNFLTGMATADCLMELPPDAERLERGVTVKVYPL